MRLKWVNRRVKWVGTADRVGRIVRLFRVIGTVGTVGDGKGYSTKFSVGLAPVLFGLDREYQGWTLFVLGVRLHWQRAYGGIHT